VREIRTKKAYNVYSHMLSELLMRLIYLIFAGLMWGSVLVERPAAFNWRWVTSRCFGDVSGSIYIKIHILEVLLSWYLAFNLLPAAGDFYSKHFKLVAPHRWLGYEQNAHTTNLLFVHLLAPLQYTRHKFWMPTVIFITRTLE
jgi:hypothetical protein